MRSNNFRRTEKVLYSYKYLKLQIEEDQKTIDQLLPDVGRSANYASPVPSNRSISDPTFNKMLIYTESKNLINQLTANISMAKNHISKIEKVLNYLEGTERKIVELKYFNELRDFQVIMELNEISGATYYRLKNEVINRFSLILWGQGIDKQ